MSTEIAVVEIEITQETAPAIYQGKGLDQFFEKIKEATNEICDATTAAGRKRIASQAFKISRSKTAVVSPGREYLKTIKALPKMIEQELRDFENKCDALRDEKRKPLDDWESEQARIEAQRAAEAAAIEFHRLAVEHEAWFDSIIAQDWELALLADQIFNRDAEDKRKAAEQAQRDREAQIAADAAAKAKADAEAAAKAEKEAAEQREREARLAQERAEQETARAAQALKDAKAKAAQDLIEEKRRAELAAEKAEADKKAAEEAAARREREAAQRERDNQAKEAKRLADEKSAREADTAHKAKINRAAVAAMIETGITEEQAKAVLLAIYKKKVPNVSINY